MKESRSIMKLGLNQEFVVGDSIEHEGIMTRAINWNDIRTLSHLFYEAYHHTVDDEGETVEEWEQELAHVRDGKYGPLLSDLSFALYDAEQLMGSILCSTFRGVPLILYVVISPTYRGRHLSKLLIHETIRSARRNHLDSLYLVVTDRNFAATRIYDAIGFARVGTDWTEVLKNASE